MRERNAASSSMIELSLGSHSGSLWNLVWDTKVSPRVRVFIWQLCREALPTLENIDRRKRGIDVCCVMCGTQVESSKHTFLECSFARQIWALSCLLWPVVSTWNEEAAEWVFHLGQNVMS
ncbi:UNVERIFIED_CONTAM: hypothetical protein Sradi_5300600 [Sesamum radiatum]|uniref:Reverse transcriptase zinc-binding domain-containing protein n=1 Tax=Sesamum radiatum TaxID=300843 RepID=A0AAW2LQD9_SESRA